uniref:Uncharacterized protein n=1 Tax=Knipowitschia caucasica TaxID=637954 RepID=A0AAV2MRQ7_KNICA
MEPACSLAVPSLFGAEKGASGLIGEKQLFEKFWKGTFKAVATPRLESVIIASIKARTRVADGRWLAAERPGEIRGRMSIWLGASYLNIRCFNEEERRWFWRGL